ncbi:hypothetical protein BCON_0049g00380 [Botryotinia convoluta]|uniref:Uncharacterized protein n=1 Tax=Botryotinia convoluta TaxID=54673 RepID=A0A4Z1IEG9_9HELO|nr:hypothetical protein BCON_0049g00380 [Botryotinia convoluta]
MFGSVLTPPPITNGTELEEPHWSKEEPPSYKSIGSYLTGQDKFHDLHLNDSKDTNDDICNEAARISTGWANASEVIIAPPSQAYFTDVGTTQSSTWWSARWSTTWAQAFGETIAAPNPVHFPSQKSRSNTSTFNLNRHTSLTGRNPHKGFHKTRKLLANQLIDRITCIHGSRHTAISSYEDLTQDCRNTYEQAADSFIKCAKNLILRSEGPNQRVDDWMIMGFIDKKYTVPGEGEKKPYLYGEWEYLWAIDEDEIAIKDAMLGKDPRAWNFWRDDWAWFPQYRIPTAEDWKWWCGEWRKVPGAIREWKPTEEIWPWQRRFWAGV